MITASITRPTPPQRTGATVLAKEAVGLVSGLVQQRRRYIQNGWSRIDHAIASRACDKLTAWLRVNPCPGPATLRAFWHQHQDSLRFIAPPGSKKMIRLHAILSHL